jgi:hypothetical protein
MSTVTGLLIAGAVLFFIIFLVLEIKLREGVEQQRADEQEKYRRRMVECGYPPETIDLLREADQLRKLDGALNSSVKAPTPELIEWISYLAMRFLITVVLLVVGVYIILSSQFTPTDKHWAYGTVGTLVGYWLRPWPSKAREALPAHLKSKTRRSRPRDKKK